MSIRNPKRKAKKAKEGVARKPERSGLPIPRRRKKLPKQPFEPSQEIRDKLGLESTKEIPEVPRMIRHHTNKSTRRSRHKR